MEAPDIRVTRRTQWMVLVLGLGLLGLLLLASLTYERQRITREQFERLSSKARVIDENIARQLEGVNNTLHSILSGHDVVLNANGGSPHQADPHLRALAEATLGVRTFLVINNKGNVLASSRAELVGMNLAAREYFMTATRQPNTDTLYLSQPFKTVLGIYSITLTRVSIDAQGRVEKLATASLDPDFFSVLLSSVRFDPDVWVSLAHIDGTLVLRFPERPDLLGTKLNQPGSFFTRHIESGHTTTVLTGTAKATGLPGWMAQRTISAPNLHMQGALVVAVARDPGQALMPWKNLSVIAALIWLVIATSSVVALAFFQRYQSIERVRLEEEELRRRKAEDEVRKLAFFDSLTGLPNRRMLMDRMAQLLSANLRQKRLSGLLFVDLDGFKQLNDTMGHDKGDLLLQLIAKRFQTEIRTEDTAARWGGDEFVIVLSDLGSEAESAVQKLNQTAHKFLDLMESSFELNEETYLCTCSIGGTIFGAQEEPIEGIFKRADRAMYQAKSSGKNACRVTSPSMG